MANQPIKMDAGNKVLLFVSAIALAGAVIFLVAQLVNWLGQMGTAERTTITEEQLAERLTPAGRVEAGPVDAADEEAADLSPGDVYQNVCAACHDTGASGAPIVDDTDEWSSRFSDKGMDTLFDHSLNGFNAMPAKGGDPSLSDDEVRRAVAYMLDQADVDHGWSPDNGAAENGNDEEAVSETAEEVAAEDEAAAEEAAANGEAVNGIDLASGDATRAENQLFGTCVACHGARGQGVGIFPSIAGNTAEFIAGRLVAYRAGETVGDDTHLMAPNARNLSDQDIADLAVYIATLEE
ncbi:c-type cytochrome [Thioalkalivibrio halophilus]|uniref:Cytochrome C class I n=1 Tax=Thioalkalivibrio halophilus TaxID=252474 RepID=A0A1V3A1V9_9GAMM|nr:c-type cytochrome [Thioalkalivibrio halophilus]OOC11325.1 cytochrome C class I [Thioalkalivibrio halophilus]